MRTLSWTTCLWPGLTALWLRGQWQGLLAAAAFAGLVNFALVCSFVWPHLLSPELPPWATPATAWVLVLGFWIAGIRSARADLARSTPPASAADPEVDAWFREAQTEYLKGHWIEVETLATKLVARRADDAEARLLLASICRRTKRLADARQTLNDLKQTPSAAKWWLEIEAELAQLAESEQETQRNPVQQNTPPLARAA